MATTEAGLRGEPPESTGVQISGPDWSRPGLDIVGGRYPLRVEPHVGRLVQRLLPGVITTTYQARTFALHGLVWAEVSRQGLDFASAQELLRRCEVVLAGISLQHDHGPWLPAPHGADVIAAAIERDGVLDVAEVQKKGRYTTSDWGFAGAYLGSEALLGIVGSGQPPLPGERLQEKPLREALGPILELARRDSLDIAELAAHPELCICGARHSPDGAWLRQVFLAPPSSTTIAASADEARRATARLLLRTLPSKAGETVQDTFRQRVAFGEFLDSDPIASAIPLAWAWRGVVLRNYSVGAWRRIWSWLVEQLSEPMSPDALGELFAAQFPDITVGEFGTQIPEHVAGGQLLPVEETLRAGHPRPDPQTELNLLILGTLRLSALQGSALKAFVGDPRNDDLGPHWFQEHIQHCQNQPLRRFAAELAVRLVSRARRVALSKMALRPDGKVWYPSRVRERQGLIFRQSSEGSGDVSLRIDSLGELLAGMGVLDYHGSCWLPSGEGERILA